MASDETDFEAQLEREAEIDASYDPTVKAMYKQGARWGRDFERQRAQILIDALKKYADRTPVILEAREALIKWESGDV